MPPATHSLPTPAPASPSSAASPPRIVIVGCGFGGIALARALVGKPVQVLVIDRNNFHLFQPLLYQVATGGLEPDSIAYPIRRIFRNAANVSFRHAEVLSIDRDRHQLSTSIGEIGYDQLILATGSATNFFQLEEKKGLLLSLKSVTDALDIRSYVMQNLEQALTVDHGHERDEIINVAIVGGGPAGIELAGALAEMRRYVLPKDFPELDLTRMRISLFEAAPRLLSSMSQHAANASLKYLRRLDVDVHLGAKVLEYDGRRLLVEGAGEFPTHTVIWTAGVRGAPVPGIPDAALRPGKRILVDEFNRVAGCEGLWAIGDVASCPTAASPQGQPMLAPVAIQQGRKLAENLLAHLAGTPLRPFAYDNKGSMATVGRIRAVVDLPRFHFEGAFAWFVWMLVHITSLVGFRNKVVAFVDWTINYLSFDRPLGLIVRPYRRTSPEKG